MKHNFFKNCLSLFLLPFVVSCAQQANEREVETESAMIEDDVHSFARPEEAVVKHLNWEADVDFEKQQIEAIARLDIETAEGADELILDTKGLNIEKVTLGEEETPAEFKVGETDKILGSPLTIAITPETEQVNVYYTTGKDAEALQWLTPAQTAGKEHPFLFTQSQAILARSWVPIQDSPGIRFTYDATVTVPENLLALMSAENPQEKNDIGVYQFEMDQPIPAYLMALTVGDVVFEPIGERTGVYAEPSVIDEAAYEFAELDEMLEAAEELYGPYRWERYDLIVLPPSFPFGGMENPRLTFATPTILAGDRSLTSLVAHELAHSWSGNLVTNATWGDFWLNEGFTVYFERRIMEALYGPEYAEMLAELGYQDLKETVEELEASGQSEDTKLKLDLKGRNPDDGVTNIAYEKGYFFLRHLENLVGREKFDAFLREYFDSNAFKTMTTQEFIEYLNENLLEPNNIEVTDQTYEAWIYEEGLPESMPVVESERFNAVDAQLAAWKNGTPAAELETKDWSSHEWLHFIRNLPEDMTEAQLIELDKAFGFTRSGNSELLAAWFMHTIAHQYEPAKPALREFLTSVGRRKFLMPLYKKLIEMPEGAQLARDIYAEARPNYHFVSTNSLDELLENEEAAQE
ncbi:M1 family metallopeptidase [Nafulsella turpanensis]|uniref:M1 family metallopeptidase n=1 Tax=Nafulsella turpanensis TaxID=1265690 RepID=UPI00034658AE|nr:M1 family metallopeptidase [Nafulsella turpanensis]